MRVQPASVVHADWSKDPARRWFATASLETHGWRAQGPYPAGASGDIAATFGVARRAHPLLVGIDIPIGVPRAYATRAGVASFRAWLGEVGKGRWSHFFEVCENPDEISLERPFYPYRPGGTTRRALSTGLALDWDDLYRRCDRGRPGRRAAGPLFWTLGGQQVGKAAVTGWRELLHPLVDDRAAGLWPFDGDLAALIASRDVTIAETYPAELYDRVGLPSRLPGGKGNQAVRHGCACTIMAAADRLRVELDDELVAAISSGFPAEEGGDDGFDAVVGLLGTIDVLETGEWSAPDDPTVLAVEGWMLGLRAT